MKETAIRNRMRLCGITIAELTDLLEGLHVKYTALGNYLNGYVLMPANVRSEIESILAEREREVKNAEEASLESTNQHPPVNNQDDGQINQGPLKSSIIGITEKVAKDEFSIELKQRLEKMGMLVGFRLEQFASNVNTTFDTLKNYINTGGRSKISNEIKNQIKRSLKIYEKQHAEDLEYLDKMANRHNSKNDIETQYTPIEMTKELRDKLSHLRPSTGANEPSAAAGDLDHNNMDVF